MNPKSHTLFHFTKSKEVLQIILKNGFWPRYCLEDVAWLGVSQFDYIGYPMVCFCDIPLSRIEDHIAFYGSFGLGMSRQWAEKNGLNPVMYVAGENHVSSEFLKLNEHANNLKEVEQKKAKITMRYLLAHAKPTTGTMVVSGEPLEKAFYQESEWRYVPKNENIDEYLLRTEHLASDKLEESNNKTKENCMLQFLPSDVKYIFVKSDAEIPSIMNFIQTDLDGYPAADLKILMSRVTSLESIHADL
jgi:hypothetical protein